MHAPHDVGVVVGPQHVDFVLHLLPGLGVLNVLSKP